MTLFGLILFDMTLFGLILFGVGAFALFMYVRSGKQGGGMLPAVGGGASLARRGAAAPPSDERTVMTLRLNDVVQIMGQDFLVEGKLTYREDGDEWWEYRLVDGRDERYLSVEDDDELEVGLWQEIDWTVPASGPPERIEWEGATYRCVERGEAAVTRDGKTGRKEGLSCRYWDYEGPDDRMLGVERWGGEWEAWAGRPLAEGAYDILPGDLVEG